MITHDTFSGLKLTKINESVQNGIGGMKVELETQPWNDFWSNVSYYTGFGYYKSETVLKELRTDPAKVLYTILHPSWIQFHPLSHLRECISCLAERTTHPAIRKKVETVVLDSIKHVPVKDTLTLAIFADAGLFQTLVLIQQIMDLNLWNHIDLHLIDPSFIHVIEHQNVNAQPDECLGILKDFLAWFPSEVLTVNIYHHSSRFVANLEHGVQPDLFIAIDWIDERGYFYKVHGDYLMAVIKLPPKTMILDFQTPFELSLKLYRRSGKSCPFSLSNPQIFERFIRDWLDNSSTSEDKELIGNLFDHPMLTISGSQWNDVK